MNPFNNSLLYSVSLNIDLFDDISLRLNFQQVYSICDS